MKAYRPVDEWWRLRGSFAVEQAIARAASSYGWDVLGIRNGL
jgi:hypothetical protein